MPVAVSAGILAKISNGFNIGEAEGKQLLENRKLKLGMLGICLARGTHSRILHFAPRHDFFSLDAGARWIKCEKAKRSGCSYVLSRPAYARASAPKENTRRPGAA